MAVQVWKYRLEMGAQAVMMPEDARPLSVNMQNQELTMWALIPDTEADAVPHGIDVVPTGGMGEGITPQACAGRFLGTVLNYSGHLVYHVFDCGPIVPREPVAMRNG